MWFAYLFLAVMAVGAELALFFLVVDLFDL